MVTQSTTYRTNPDVAYDADPNTGFPVYDSYSNPSAPWGQWGGTSDAAPQWAALIAIADQGRALAGKASLGRRHADVAHALRAAFAATSTTSPAARAPGIPVIRPGPGYDLVTGRGTPYANLVVAGLVGSSTTTTTAATHFSITATPEHRLRPATRLRITVTALDSSQQHGYRLYGHGPLHQFRQRGRCRWVPARQLYVHQQRQGRHTFTVTLVTAGSQTVTATDTANSSLLGSVAVTVVPGALDHIAFGQTAHQRCPRRGDQPGRDGATVRPLR